jgi:hypothetical protein
MSEVQASEPRSFWNWELFLFYGIGTPLIIPVLAIVGYLINPLIWLALVPLVLVDLVYWRQRVTVYEGEVLLRGIVTERRVSYSEIERLSVVFSRGLLRVGWRVRLSTHHGDLYTLTFFNFNLRFVGGTFAAPPHDAPEAVKELYSLLAAKMATAR